MNKMTFIGWIGLTALACQSNTEGYQIKGNIEGAGNGIAIMTLPVGREEPTTGDTVKMKNGVFTFTGKLEAPSWVSIQVCPDKEKPAALRMQNAGPARRAPVPFSRKRPIPLKAGAEML